MHRHEKGKASTLAEVLKMTNALNVFYVLFNETTAWMNDTATKKKYWFNAS